MNTKIIVSRRAQEVLICGLVFPAVICLVLLLAVLASPCAAQSVSSEFTIDTRGSSLSAEAGSLDFTINTLSQNGSEGAASGEFTIETRGEGPLLSYALSALPGFALDTRRFPNAQPLTIAGQVVDSAGNGIATATVEISQTGVEPTVVASASDGGFLATGLRPLAYHLKVTAPYYVPALVTVDGNAGGIVTRQIQLNSMMMPLALPAKGRDATVLEAFPTQPANGARLRFFAAGQWLDSGTLDPGKPTVVMTHGWTSNSSAWALGMAQEMTAKLAVGQWNIVAWDWEEEAAEGVGQVVPSDKTPGQGAQLGERMYELLGAGYSQRLHFIGHSLGTLVNRYACDWLHSAGRWNNTATQPHVTLLDEAELASIQGSYVITSTRAAAVQVLDQARMELTWSDLAFPALALNDVATRVSLEALGRAVTAAAEDWKDPVPTSAAYVDNYVSLVGLNRPEAANVCLIAPFEELSNPFQIFDFAHGYSYEWYRRTAGFVGTVSMGIPRSVEAGAVVPPFEDQYRAGAHWLQAFGPGRNEMQLSRVPELFPGECMALGLFNAGLAQHTLFINSAKDTIDAGGQALAKGATGIHTTVINLGAGFMNGVKITGSVTQAALVKAGTNLDAGIDQLLDYSKDITADLRRTSPNYWETVRFVLAAGGGLRNRPRNGPAGVAGPGVWVNVRVPQDAAMMAFDFGISGDPVNDCIVAAVEGKNTFHLPGKYLESDVIQSSDFQDISQWAGQNVELYFGFIGGSSSATALIEGIRFITMSVPEIAMRPSAVPGSIDLHWPAAAAGWQPVESSSLSNGSWTPVDLGGVVLEAGTLTATISQSPQRMFYKLQKRVPQ